VLDGASLEAAFERARKIADAEHLVLCILTTIRSSSRPGHGFLELLEDAPDLDALVVPIGGGGLISGIALAAKALKPDIEIYGVEAKLYPSMYDAVKGEQLPCAGRRLPKESR